MFFLYLLTTFESVRVADVINHDGFPHTILFSSYKGDGVTVLRTRNLITRAKHDLYVHEDDEVIVLRPTYLT